MSLDRRSFLKLGGAGIVGVAFVPLLAACEDNPTGPYTGSSVSFLTPNDRFFIQHGGRDTLANWTMPNIQRDAWTLNIVNFLGETLRSVTFADLMTAKGQGKEVTMLKTIQCILESPVRPRPNGFTGNAYWTGIPLKHFLDQAGLDLTSAKRLILRGADGFINNLLPSRITDPGDLLQPLLAYKMNGQDLTREHGAPVRLIIQEMYGYKNMKWITEVSATLQNREIGTYQNEGFIDDGVMRVNSRATNLHDTLTVPKGEIEISGFAVSGSGSITTVEVSIDDGPFQPASFTSLGDIMGGETLPQEIVQIATLGASHYPYLGVWAKWHHLWNAAAGDHTVAIRATDSSGAVQPAMDIEMQDGQNGVTTYKVKVQ